MFELALRGKFQAAGMIGGVAMIASLDFELTQLRLLWLITRHPNGIVAADLCAEFKRRGWVVGDLTPADLDLNPDELLRSAVPAMPVNDNGG
jgi:hypothetical protein